MTELPSVSNGMQGSETMCNSLGLIRSQMLYPVELRAHKSQFTYEMA
jgi:hypothetical protein